MRFAHTTLDVAELLSDYEVEILLTDNKTIEFIFPFSAEELAAIKKNQDWVNGKYGHYKTTADKNIRRNRHTTYVIRSLVGNPRFRRLTTVSSQLNSFRIANNKSETKYSQIRVVKKKDGPLHMVFTKQIFAKRFFSDIKSSKLFKKVKV
jgi:hypothetical protein